MLAACSATSVESRPPLASTPTGTSASRWSRTAARAASRARRRARDRWPRALARLLRTRSASRSGSRPRRPAITHSSPGPHLGDAGKAGARRRHVAAGEIGVDPGVVGSRRHQAGREQRLDLRAEADACGDRRVVERLHADAIARQHDSTAAAVEHGDPEHAAQRLDERVAALFVEVDDHLGVAGALEPVTAGEELGAQLAMVVDLAVRDHRDGAVLVLHRLAAARRIRDREPAAGDAAAPGAVDDGAEVVGAAMMEGPPHPLDQSGELLPRHRGADDAGDAAHDRPRA